MPITHNYSLFTFVVPRFTSGRYRMTALTGGILLLDLGLDIRCEDKSVRIISMTVETEIFLVLPYGIIVWGKEHPLSRAVRIAVAPIRHAIPKTGDICRVCRACPICFHIRGFI